MSPLGFIRWLLGTEEDALEAIVDERTDPGTRVRCDDGTEGVLSGLLMLDGALYARVVFVGPHTSWVDVIAAERLDLA